MKKLLFVFGFIAFAGLHSCSENKKQTNNVIADTLASAKPIKKEISLPPHNDDGKAYFSFIVKKGDSVVNNISSKKPVAFQGSKNIILQLDSSHHLLVNGSGLNIYLNEKTDGEYPITSGSGKKEASILGSWLEKDETRTSYSVQQGTVNITRLVNDSCTGKFEGGFKLNGSDYTVMGEFYNVKVN